MSRALPKFIPDPRIWTVYQVACRLRMSEDRFRRARADLEALGFPRRDDLLDGWDAAAIEHWLDARAGLTSGGNDNALREELRQWQG